MSIRVKGFRFKIVEYESNLIFSSGEHVPNTVTRMKIWRYVNFNQDKNNTLTVSKIVSLASAFELSLNALTFLCPT